MIRAAIVGAGAIAAHGHIPALRAHRDRVQPVAVVDVDGARARAFAAEHGIPAVHTGLTGMLAAERPDLVLVCTPPHLHAGQAVECLEAGAWVWCEKPLCRSLAEYDRIQAAEGSEDPEGAGGPYLTVVYQQRFGSGAEHLRELAGSGALGRPLVGLCTTAWHRGEDYYAVPYRGRWETEGGGTTVLHGIHQMDLMLSVFGDWAEIRAMAGRLDRQIETEDVSMAAVRFASGAMASVVTSVLCPRQESHLRFDFAGGTVELRHLYGHRNEHWTSSSPLWAPPRDVPSGHEAQLGTVLDAFARGERPPASGADGRRAMEFVTGLYASALTGRPVRREEITPDSPFYHRLDGGLGL
ncbi:oxidoreductase [Planomonospora parontospora subsp. parontospora]|uniref:Oxidoreductase n=2 Tax=Planomonospora parontospora TaxID=58119 RepID=A0AA37BJ31_9ACTN|nr:Gfo/Idh/MocA family oxidoreductase [Planomonospora parontospora]GGK78332.1 oxidoreductase [Planomonospora parontospora]GII10340.1 oxidoreductase [Planomonospora parontospora subsp. parontospora]